MQSLVESRLFEARRESVRDDRFPGLDARRPDRGAIATAMRTGAGWAILRADGSFAGFGGPELAGQLRVEGRVVRS